MSLDLGGERCRTASSDVPCPHGQTSDPPHYDETIFTPHTTTNVSIVKDANNNALSTEANFITPPSASYPAATLSDSIVPRQPAQSCSCCGC